MTGADPAGRRGSVHQAHPAAPGSCAGCRRHVQIIKVDPVSGALKFTFAYGRDMFPTEVGANELLQGPCISHSTACCFS